MKKRFLVRLGVLLLLAAAAFVFVLWWTTPNHRINVDSFKKIKNGMTLDEVVQIVGVPPGHYGAPSKNPGTIYLLASDAVLDPFKFEGTEHVEEWHSDVGKLMLILNKEHIVIAAQFESYGDDGLLAKIRRWLGLVQVQ
ncbi:MAG: hypothetical protein L0Y58_00330 [Verrucomicrobia subdivision 3 bacterium]|nr:hypothetical protein [Limisphaerales bacterium]